MFVSSCWLSVALQLHQQPITEGAGCHGDDHVVLSAPDYSADTPLLPAPPYSFVPLCHLLPFLFSSFLSLFPYSLFLVYLIVSPFFVFPSPNLPLLRPSLPSSLSSHLFMPPSVYPLALLSILRLSLLTFLSFILPFLISLVSHHFSLSFICFFLFLFPSPTSFSSVCPSVFPLIYSPLLPS